MVHLKICLWNCWSVRPKKEELIQWAQSNGINVFMLTETWLNKFNQFRMRGFSIFRTDRDDGKGGSLIAVHEEIPVSQIQIVYNHPTIQINAVKIGDLTLIVTYVKPGAKIHDAFWTEILVQVTPPFVFMGDFNAHFKQWGSASTTRMGRILDETVRDFDLCLLNSAESTLISYPPANGSILDLTFVSRSIKDNVSWSLPKISLGSNHYPTITEVIQPIQAFWNTQHTMEYQTTRIHDWDLYRERVDNKLEAYTRHKREDPTISEINNSIQQVIRAPPFCKQTSRTQRKHRSVPWWDLDCKRVAAQRKIAFTRYKQNMTYNTFLCYKEACAKVRKMCNKKRREAWKTFTNSIQCGVNTKVIWYKLNRIKGSIEPRQKTTLIHEELLLQLHSTFAPSTVIQKPFEVDINNQNENPIMDAPFSLQELLVILKNLKTNSSPGIDGISYLMYKNLSLTSHRMLLSAYNKVWSCTEIPTDWQYHKLIPIPKQDFNNDDAKKLRPIVLSSCSRKIYERLILQRIQDWTLTSAIIPSWQFAFIKGRGTTDCLSTLVVDIFLSFLRREYCCVVFIDLKSAYDLVDINILLAMLQKYKMSNKMLQNIQSLMVSNTTSIVHKNIQTAPRSKDSGLVQGGILSPILFTIFTIEIGTLIRKYARIIQYADDFAIYSAHKNIDVCKEKLQNALREVQTWTQSTGMEISLPKLRLIAFSKRKRKEISVIYNNKIITQVRHTKFLGVDLDEQLNFKVHSEKMVQKADKLVRIMRVMCSTKEGAHPAIMLSFYRATLRSIFDYGCMFFDMANAECLKKLDVKQAAAIKVCLGVLKSTPNMAVCIESGETSLKSRRLLLSTKFILKQLSTSPLIHKIKLADEILSSRSNKNRWKPPMLINAWKLIHEHFANISFPRQYPCYETPLHIQLQATLVFNPNNNASSQSGHINTLQKKQSFLCRIQTEYSKSLLIYTDGSKITNNRFVGAAIYCPELRVYEGYSLPRHCTIFSSESFAIRQALIFIKHRNIKHATICSDCLSALNAINYNGWSTREIWITQNIRKLLYQISNNGGTINFVWVPGHANIRGNEIADTIAKAATSTGERRYNIILPWQDIYTYMKKIIVSSQLEVSTRDYRPSNYYTRNNDNASAKLWFKKAAYTRSEISLIMRCRTNHALTPRKLHQMRLRETDQCDCGDGIGDLNHILLACQRFQEERKQLFATLIACGEQFPTSIVALMANPTQRIAKALDRFTKKCKLKL